MAEGWLCDSILKAQPRPSPISTNPAFSSPASTSRCGPFLGRVLSHRMEFLYEQCSDHMIEKIESSVKLGVRPRTFLIISNSSGRSPRSFACSSVDSSFVIVSIGNIGDLGHKSTYFIGVNWRNPLARSKEFR